MKAEILLNKLNKNISKLKEFTKEMDEIVDELDNVGLTKDAEKIRLYLLNSIKNIFGGTNILDFDNLVSNLTELIEEEKESWCIYCKKDLENEEVICNNCLAECHIKNEPIPQQRYEIQKYGRKIKTKFLAKGGSGDGEIISFFFIIDEKERKLLNDKNYIFLSEDELKNISLIIES